MVKGRTLTDLTVLSVPSPSLLWHLPPFTSEQNLLTSSLSVERWGSWDVHLSSRRNTVEDHLFLGEGTQKFTFSSQDTFFLIEWLCELAVFVTPLSLRSQPLLCCKALWSYSLHERVIATLLVIQLPSLATSSVILREWLLLWPPFHWALITSK